MGILDQLCSANTVLRYPKLYSRQSSQFDNGVFWVWIINALFHSVLLFWLPLYAVKNDIIWRNGKEGGYLVLGNMVYTYVVVTVCIKAGLHMKYWTWLTHLAIWGSIIAWFMLIVVYSQFWPTVPLGQVMSGMDRMIFTSPVFWFGLVLIPLAVLITDISILAFKSTVFKTLTESVRESEIRKTDPRSVIDESKSSRSWRYYLLHPIPRIWQYSWNLRERHRSY